MQDLGKSLIDADSLIKVSFGIQMKRTTVREEEEEEREGRGSRESGKRVGASGDRHMTTVQVIALREKHRSEVIAERESRQVEKK